MYVCVNYASVLLCNVLHKITPCQPDQDEFIFYRDILSTVDRRVERHVEGLLKKTGTVDVHNGPGTLV